MLHEVEGGRATLIGEAVKSGGGADESIRETVAWSRLRRLEKSRPTPSRNKAEQSTRPASKATSCGQVEQKKSSQMLSFLHSLSSYCHPFLLYHPSRKFMDKSSKVKKGLIFHFLLVYTRRTGSLSEQRKENDF